MSARRPDPARRRTLKALGASGLVALLERNLAFAQGGPDYRALVCVYQLGGNDGENTLVRYDAAGYQTYSAVRTPASGINLPQAQLLPVQPARGGPPMGFHPACTAFKSLFDRRKLAIVANMGMLAQPSGKPGLEAHTTLQPANLFSHNDQMLALQSADHLGFSRVGWGGRLADKMTSANAGTVFPPVTSVDGLQTFVFGQTLIPLTVPPNPNFRLSSMGLNRLPLEALRDAALNEILAQPHDNVYDVGAQALSRKGFAASSVVYPILQNPSSAVTPLFAGLSGQLAAQFKTIAQLIEGRGQTGLKRQVFMVQQGGYDTHGGQLATQHRLLTELNESLDAFDRAMEAIGTSANVTTFTLTDFGRTFKPAANQGTDHGWGNYAFVTGGAVKGGDLYGTLPTQVLDGPDDFGKEGRWIPTTALEQYGATLARWFGVAEADLPYVFPNIGSFGTSQLGFMG